MFMRAVILAEQNRRDEAIKAFTEITDKYPTLPEPYNNLAVIYADQGQYDKAKKALENAIKTNPSYATAHENLGDIYAKMASEAYGKALQLDGANTRAQGKLSMIRDLFSSGKPALLANRTPQSKEPVKPLSSANVAIKPIEPAKPVEMPKPAEVASTVKPVEPIKPAVKPIEVAKSEMTKPEVTKSQDSKTVEAKNATEKAPLHTDHQRDISNAVNQWAKAWTNKNVDGYLAYYADSFKAPDGQSRKEWESTRRSRIDKHEAIRVEVSNLNIKMIDDSHAQASFKQSYTSGSLSKRTSKVLNMKRVGDRWLIEQEIAN
jgi:tetratricopeptide (TPR) repeat protein